MRKATDVILELEEKINLILGYVKVIDTNIKLLYNRLGDNNNENIFITTDNTTKLPVKDKSNNITQTDAIKDTNKTPFVKTVSKNNVTQKIIYKSDHKNVILATILIYDNNKNVIYKTKTNMTGSWVAQLVPGNYIVHIIKGGTTKPPRNQVDIKYNFTINDNNTNQLETLEV